MPDPQWIDSYTLSWEEKETWGQLADAEVKHEHAELGGEVKEVTCNQLEGGVLKILESLKIIRKFQVEIFQQNTIPYI